jgi:hypothetical protein
MSALVRGGYCPAAEHGIAKRERLVKHPEAIELTRALKAALGKVL